MTLRLEDLDAFPLELPGGGQASLRTVIDGRPTLAILLRHLA